MTSLRFYAACAISFIAGCLAVVAWKSVGVAAPKPVASTPADSAGVSQPAPQAATASAANCPRPLAIAAQNDTNKPPERKLDALLKQVLTLPDAAERDPVSATIELLKSSPRDRADLMARYAKERDEFARKQMRLLLMFLPNEDVIAFAMNMANDGNAATRSEGYTLLRQSQHSAAAHALMLKAVRSEQDARALTEAIASLMPGEAPTAEQAAPVVELLKGTLTHSSPEVRGESLLALTRWDRTAGAEELVFNGLNDPNAPVQQAALTALFEKRLQTDRIKTALLQLAGDGKNMPQARMMAMDALSGFVLTQQEQRTISALRDSMPPPRRGE